MSMIKVFELAKELNVPAKQLLLELHKAGVSVEGYFSFLSSEEAKLVREITNTSGEIVLEKSPKGKDLPILKLSNKKKETAGEIKTTKSDKSYNLSKRLLDFNQKWSLSKITQKKEVEKSTKKRVQGQRKESSPKDNYNLSLKDLAKMGTISSKSQLLEEEVELIKSDGDKSEGEWKDGERHGKGTQTYSNGNIYEGEWKNGERHGQGVLTLTSGTKYTGEWKHGEKHGKGTVTFTNGANYTGEWRKGKPNGQGTHILENGTRYDGASKDGKYPGVSPSTSVCAK